MGKEYPEIDQKIAEWVARQEMFFVSTAPLSADGLINCSPKGMDTFRVIDAHTVAYLDLTGSGIETIAHLKENSRIVIMLCAFEGPPQIVRFHGKGEVFQKDTAGYAELLGHFHEHAGARSIIRVSVDRISDSCGYSVPLYSFEGHRETLAKWAKNKGDEGVVEYQKQKNAKSIDGLEGIAHEPGN